MKYAYVVIWSYLMHPMRSVAFMRNYHPRLATKLSTEDCHDAADAELQEGLSTQWNMYNKVLYLCCNMLYHGHAMMILVTCWTSHSLGLELCDNKHTMWGAVLATSFYQVGSTSN